MATHIVMFLMYMRGHARNRGIGSPVPSVDFGPNIFDFSLFLYKQRGRKKLSVRGRIQREWWKVNEELPQDAILFFFLIKQRKGNLFLRGSGDNAAKFSK